jgi:hypothetical protein
MEKVPFAAMVPVKVDQAPAPSCTRAETWLVAPFGGLLVVVPASAQ